MFKHTLSALALASFLFGCAQPELAPVASAPELDESGARATEGSPEALGMLAFLNDAGTTYELLDNEVGLDRRAAESIIAHRNGPDGELGWLQDRLFETVAEVDDCYYVGTTALNLIEQWALDHDWVALNDDDVLGIWDGVSFTVAEAEATLELANTAGAGFMDDDLGLDSRAVNSIVDARPIASVKDLSELYYVGKSALTSLKGAAAGQPDCAVEGWETLYIYDEGDGAWRAQLPAEFVAVVDEVVQNDGWCGEATGEAWFVKATVDRFNCEDKGYTIELGQHMLEYPEVVWYIEFEVDSEYDFFHSTCEV